MRGGTAGGDQGGANAHARRAFELQPVQGFQQGLEGTRRQRLAGPVLFVLLKSAQALRLVDAFGFVRKQHRIAVKGNANFIWMRFSGFAGFWKNAGCWKACINRCTDIIFVCRQKKIGM